MLGQCWATVYDAGPALTQHMAKVSSLPGSDDSVVWSVVAVFDADVPVSVICVRGHGDPDFCWCGYHGTLGGPGSNPVSIREINCDGNVNPQSR